eukprot:m.122613 g.122613  ORF g.122613 m.122613 type:complete len:243 (+) comp9633_c0_seq2:1321-2049(+)
MDHDRVQLWRDWLRTGEDLFRDINVETDGPAFAEALRIEGKTSLDLMANNLQLDEVAVIANALPQVRLTALYLGYSDIGDIAAEALAATLRQSSLTVLQIWNTQIGDTGAVALANSLPFSSLTVLHLWCNNIGDPGAAAIAAALPESRQLTELYLRSDNIRDTGTKELAEALPKSNVIVFTLWGKFLNAERCGIAALAAALPKSRRLEELSLGYEPSMTTGLKTREHKTALVTHSPFPVKEQ